MNGVSDKEFHPDRTWWRRLFAVIDAGDAAGFIGFLTSDAQFRFGNSPMVVGADAIRAAVASFFSAIGSSHHEVRATWSAAGSAVCEGRVTYTHHDGSSASYPFVNVFELRGEKIAAYRIYIDLSSLFSPAA